jgi:uncharacterized protein
MQVIEQTQNWINKVVIGHNFCPFAAKAMLQNSVHYHVMPNHGVQAILEQLALEMQRLDENAEIETSFILLSEGFLDFYDYLDLVDVCEQLLVKLNYEGVYQLATFHPEFMFAEAEADDAANYTNRSPYPMLHLLREESVSRAVDTYPDTEGIPERNIAHARERGAAYFQSLLKG